MYNDVFADIINVLLITGERQVKEDELEEESLNSSYKADGKLHAQERDVAKYWRKGLVRIALYGLENQTDIDRDMPLRLFSYVENRGIRIGIEKGIEKGENTILSLMKYLLSNGRPDDAKRATEDEAYRNKLLR